MCIKPKALMDEQKTLTTILKTNLSCQDRMFVDSVSLLQVIFLFYLSFCKKRIKEYMKNTQKQWKGDRQNRHRETIRLIYLKIFRIVFTNQ